MHATSGTKRASIERLRACIAAVGSDGRVRAESEYDAVFYEAVDAPTPKKRIETAHGPHCEVQQAQRDEEPSEDPKRTFEGTFKKVERLCLVREQSSVKLAQRLVREGYDERLVEDAIHQAQSWGLLDDARYAEVLVRSRLAAGKGIAGIERELAQCGIALDDVNGWPEDFEACQDSEEERAFAVLRKHPPRSKNVREGAYRKLATKGFSASVAASVARAWAEKQGQAAR